jgi:diguanylate cyclase (GGDEF)-like protein
MSETNGQDSSGPSGTDTNTADLEVIGLSESGLTAVHTTTAPEVDGDGGRVKFEANLILIAHPEDKRLGMRVRLTPGTSIEIGRSPTAEIALPEVLSISRQHARLTYAAELVSLEDLGSTNGTYVNGHLIDGPTVLKSGDRFQVAGVHFKFLHERDPEHAYYETIYDLVTRDGLTEIYNRRKYEEEAEREFARAKRHHRPLCLITFDLDDFKLINDTYGHLCGDFVLKQITTLVAAVLRPEQVFARVGGDEFVILTPETTIAGSEALAEKLRERVAGLEYTYCGCAVRVTCSFGVAQLDGDMTRPEHLREAADRALLGSKRAGRNRVGLARTEVPAGG